MPPATSARQWSSFTPAPIAKPSTGDEAATDRELARLRRAAAAGAEIGLEIHAGHGLTFESVGPVAAIPQVVELNIGHFLVGEALFVGLDESIRIMRAAMDQARGGTG